MIKIILQHDGGGSRIDLGLAAAPVAFTNGKTRFGLVA